MTVDAILDATDLVAEAGGIEAVKMVRVARRAGVSQGTLYEYFPNVHALLAAWDERNFARSTARIGIRAQEMLVTRPSYRDCIRELVGMLLDDLADKNLRFKIPSDVEFLSLRTARIAIAEQAIAFISGALEHAKGLHMLRATDAAATRVTVNLAAMLADDYARSSLPDDARRAYKEAILDAVVHVVLPDAYAGPRAGAAKEPKK